jgi:transposase
VTKAHRYDPDLNPTYYNFALHCGFGIVPARPYKPRDKAKVKRRRWPSADRGGAAPPQALLSQRGDPRAARRNHRPAEDGTRRWERLIGPP